MMMKLLTLTFLVFISGLSGALVSVSHAAEPVRRALEMELEEVEGVKGYEVQVVRFLKDNSKKPPVVFKLKNNQWNANLVPGRYQISVRSIDSRGVPGEWGQAQEILVKIPAPSIKFPMNEEQVKSSEEKTHSVKFQWLKVDGAEKYKVKVFDSAGKLVAEKETSDDDFEATLPVAQIYSWEITPVFEGSLEGDATGRNTFVVVGAKLDQPSTHHVEDFNTTLIDWKAVNYAQKYNYQLERKNENGKWTIVESKIINQASKKFQKPLQTGEYRIRVKALADRRIESDEMYQEFKTQNLNRSPAAIEQIKSEGSFETKSRFFALASYYASIIQYAGRNIDKSKIISYNAIGGTGRLGAGIWFKEDGPWGLQVITDLSGYTIGEGGQTFIYTSAQLNGVYRYRLGVLGQLRATFGLQYRELPVTIGNSQDQTKYDQSSLNTLGPQAGFSLAHGITRKLGFQVNASGMMTAMKVSTPNGQSVDGELSYQLGALGSYKLSDSLVGFMGYAYRIEKGSYKVDTVQANSNSQGNTISASETNTVKIDGHFINLMLEYGF